jgi:hypothetical protein
MGKSVIATNLLSRVKGFWGWFIKKSPAFIVLTSLTVVSVFGLGVGGTLAATGIIPNPFSAQASNELEDTTGELPTDGQDTDIDFDELPPWEVTLGTADKEWTQGQGEWLPGSSWTSFGAPDTIAYRWTNTQLHTRFMGPCPSEIVWVSVSPPNYGYLSQVVYPSYAPVGGIQSIGGGGGIGISAPVPGHPDCRDQRGIAVGNFKCYNFNEVWVDITGPTPVAGSYRIPIPESVPKLDCPAGSEKNDPTKFTAGWDLTNYPQAVLTPPTKSSPPRVELGPYLPATPTPSATTEPSPTPTPETSPTPTTEPSPTPSSP